MDGIEITDQRIRLLEAIDALGSISAAARTVGLTYRGAWDAVAVVNNLAEHPLVLGRAGGKSGGGASLTETADSSCEQCKSSDESCIDSPIRSALNSEQTWSFPLCHGVI